MKNTIHLRTAVHVALFNAVLLPHMTVEKGRWFGANPSGHETDWVGMKASEHADDLGTNFVPKKQNYNYNDLSHYDDAEENTKVMLTVASAAAKREVSKKELLQILEDIKFTLKMRNSKYVPASAQPDAPPAVDAVAPPADEATAEASADDEKTVAELAAESEKTDGEADQAA